MSTLSKEQIRDELMQVHKNVKELTGQNMCFFRPPYGDYNNLLIQTATECGYLSIQWDIDSLDWKDYGVQSIIDRTALNPELSNGSVLLKVCSSLDVSVNDFSYFYCTTDNQNIQ